MLNQAQLAAERFWDEIDELSHAAIPREVFTELMDPTDLMWFALKHAQVDQFSYALRRGGNIAGFYVDRDGSVRRIVLWFAGLLKPGRLRNRVQLIPAYLQMFRLALPFVKLRESCVPHGFSVPLGGPIPTIASVLYREATLHHEKSARLPTGALSDGMIQLLNQHLGVRRY